jgi:hypothetical protein
VHREICIGGVRDRFEVDIYRLCKCQQD